MKTRLSHILILILGLAFLSCEGVQVAYLHVSEPDEELIPADGGSITLDVSASSQPRAASEEYWLKTSVRHNGDDSYLVTLTARKNIREEERSGKVTLSIEDLSETITIRQQATKPDNEDDDDTAGDDDDMQQDDNEDNEQDSYLQGITRKHVTLIAGQTDTTLLFETNMSIEQLVLETAEPWIDTDLKEGRINLHMELNEGLEDRTSSVTLKALTDEGKALEWQVTQVPTIVEKEGMVLFDDLAFRKAVITEHDTDRDGELSYAEAEAIQDLNVASLGITSLKGIEHMSGLRSLDVSDNNVTRIDLSARHRKFYKLKHDDDLQYMDLSGCTKMIFIELNDRDNDGIPKDYKLKETLKRGQKTRYPGNESFLEGQYFETTWLEDEYESTDFSESGTLKTLKTHTKGKGHKIYITLCGFNDEDVASEVDDYIMQALADRLFLLEPMTSFQEYFDVIYVVNVSQTRKKLLHPKAASITIFEEVACGPYLGLCYNSMLLNEEPFYQTTDFRAYSCNDDLYTIYHEYWGHSFAKLDDERGGDKDHMPYERNLTVQSDPENAPWSRLLKHDDYKDWVFFNRVSELHGGVYDCNYIENSKPSSINGYSSIMDYCSGSKDIGEIFNAVSRYWIFYEILAKCGIFKEECPLLTQEERESDKTYAFMNKYEDWVFERFVEHDRPYLERLKNGQVKGLSDGSDRWSLFEYSADEQLN